MQDKEDFKNRKKMNTLELLYNKALMKAAAEESENVKKTKVWSLHIIYSIHLYPTSHKWLAIQNDAKWKEGVIMDGQKDWLHLWGEV